MALELYGFGCLKLHDARLLLIPRTEVEDCASVAYPRKNIDRTSRRQHMLAASYQLAQIQSPIKCHGLSIWRGPPTGTSKARLSSTIPRIAGEFCAVVAAEFDQDWRKQEHPDPQVAPRSIAARSRIEEHYSAAASDGDMRVDEYRTKLFPVFQTFLQITLPSASSEEETSTSSTTLPAIDVVDATQQPSGGDSTSLELGTRSTSVGATSLTTPQTTVHISTGNSLAASSGVSTALEEITGTGLQEGVLLGFVLLVGVVAALCVRHGVATWRLRRKAPQWHSLRATSVGHASATDSEAAQEELEDL